MTVTALQEPERPFCVVDVPVKAASASSAAMRRLEMSEMRPLKGKRLATSARKELMSREMSSSAGVGEVTGAVKTSERKERAMRKENEVFIFFSCADDRIAGDSRVDHLQRLTCHLPLRRE